MQKNEMNFDTDIEKDIEAIKYIFKINAVIIYILFLILVFILNICKIEPIIKYIVLIGFILYICVGLKLLRHYCLKADLVKVKKDLENICSPNNNFYIIGVDAITLHIGNNLVKFADPNKLINEECDDGMLLSKIAAKRKEVCNKLDYNFPYIRIIENSEIEQNKCRILIRNNIKSEFQVYPEYLAIENYNGDENIVFTKENYITFENPVSIIKKEDLPQNHNYRIYSAIEIILEHIEYITVKYADEILTNDDIKPLIDLLNNKEQKENLLKDLNSGIIKNVYANLIKEQICLLDIIKFFELYNEYKKEYCNADYISEKIRTNNTFRTQITNQYKQDLKIKAFSISNNLEDLILNAKTNQQEEEIIKLLLDKINPNSKNLIICSKPIRLKLYRLINEIYTKTNIIAYSEILKNVELEIIENL